MRVVVCTLLNLLFTASFAQEVTWLEMNKKLNQGDTLGAIYYLKDILKEKKDSSAWQVHFNLGLLLQKAEQADSSVYHFLKATKQNPALYQPHYFIGHHYFENQNMELAIQHYSLYLIKDPDNDEILHYRAQAYMKTGDFFSAVSDWTQLIKKAEEAGIVFNRGLSRLGMSDYERAIDDFERALTLGGPADEIKYYLGLCYEKLYDLSVARKYYRQVLKLNPDHVNSNYRLSTIYFRKGNHRKSCEYLQKAIGLGLEQERVDEAHLTVCNH